MAYRSPYEFSCCWFYRFYICVASSCFGLLSLTTHAGGLGFCQCVCLLSFQSHIIGFEVSNLFSCLCLVQVVSCDLSDSTFRTASPHYPAVLSLLVTSLPCTALQGYINAMVWWNKKSHQQLILLIVSSRLIEGAGHWNRLVRSLEENNGSANL